MQKNEFQSTNSATELKNCSKYRNPFPKRVPNTSPSPPHLGVDAENLEAALLVGHTELNLAVEAAEAAQRGVERVRPIGGTDDDDLPAALDAVHQRLFWERVDKNRLAHRQFG